MAAATAGLILGSLLAGPVAERVMRRGGAQAATPAPVRVDPTGQQGAVLMPITAEQLLFVLLVCLACIGGAHLMHGLMQDSGVLLPDFLWALLIGMVVRNVAPLLRRPAHQRQRRAGVRQRLAVAVPDHGADVDAHPGPRDPRRAAAADRAGQRGRDGGVRVLHHRRG